MRGVLDMTALALQSFFSCTQMWVVNVKSCLYLSVSVLSLDAVEDRKRSGQVPVPLREHVRLREADHQSSVGLRGARLALSLPESRGLLRTLSWN